jgi:hypothetical protein
LWIVFTGFLRQLFGFKFHDRQHAEEDELAFDVGNSIGEGDGDVVTVSGLDRIEKYGIVDQLSIKTTTI